MIKKGKEGSVYLTRPQYTIPFPELHETPIKIYSVSDCPKCEALKAAMPPLSFETVDMSTPEALTELRINGVFSLSAPILRIKDEFYTVEDLFHEETLDVAKVNKLCMENR